MQVAELPTQAMYGELQAAFTEFNHKLFLSKLPPCLIILSRKTHVQGHYCANRYVNSSGETTDEIALNPEYFSISLQETMQTLVHEMTHLWQAHYGNVGRRGYHNEEWAEKMESIGLMPTNTGRPGGRRTGENMGDFMIDGGKFSKTLSQLVTAQYKLTWVDKYVPLCATKSGSTYGNFLGTGADAESEATTSNVYPVQVQINNNSKATRNKYVCNKCGNAAWGKPGMHILCVECNSEFEEIGT